MNRKTKNILLSGLLVALTCHLASAQAPAAAPASQAAKAVLPEILYSPSFYLLVFLFIILFAAVVALTKSLNKLAYSLLPEEKKKAIKKESESKSSEDLHAPSFWTKFDRAVLTRAVPVEMEADVMLDHDYDGIKELDNSLPPWWVWGFYITIFWAVIYLVHYHVIDTGPLSVEEYTISMQEAEKQIREHQSKMANFVSAETVKRLETPEALGSGKDVYTKNCVACHGPQGEGTVGPNLTDDFWIHGGGIKNIFLTVTNGVPAKGMISWKSQLTPKQIQEVSSYIMSLHGSKPANGKEPQGDKWVEAGTSAPAANDSTTVVKDSSAVPTAAN